MRVIHTVANLRSDHGGPTRSIAALCTELQRQAVDVDLVTRARRENEPPSITPILDASRIHFVEEWNALGFVLPRRSRFGRCVADLLGRATGDDRVLLHDHGLWLPTNHVAARVARSSRRPHVISPRGMLSPWAMRFRRWKKLAAWHLYQAHDLHTANVIHVTSAQEAADVRALGLRQPLAMIPNGVEIPPDLSTEEGVRMQRRALFLSRLHPVKGLLNLVAAWARVNPEGWELTIVGPDADGHGHEARELASRAGVEQNIAFAGEVNDDEKWRVYRDADLFVLPTLSENFGIVIAEAMAAGLPVITTKGAPWSALQTHRAGWWIDIGVEPLAAALQEATAADVTELRAMGRRGREYVKRELSWQRVTHDMVRMYSWIATGGERPAFTVMT